MNRTPSLSPFRRRLTRSLVAALPLAAVLAFIPLQATVAGASVSPCQNGTYTSLYFCSIPDAVTFNVTVAGGGGGMGGVGDSGQTGGAGGGGTIQTATMSASAGDDITVSPGTGGGDSPGGVSDPSGTGGNAGTADGGQGGSTLAGKSGGGGGGGGYSVISDSTTSASLTSGGGGGGGGGGGDDGVTNGGTGGFNGGDGSTADGGAGGTGGGSGSAQGGAGNPGQLTAATSENPAGGYSAGGGGGGGGCDGGTGGSPGGTNASAGGGGGGTSCSSGNVSDVATAGPTNIGNGYVTISGLPSPGAPTAVVNEINGSAPSEGATYSQYQAVLTSFSCSEGTNSEWSLGLSDCFDASGNATTNGSPGPLNDSDEIGNVDTQSIGNGLTYNACAISNDSGTTQVCSTTYTYNVVATLPSAGPPSVTSLDFNGSAATDGTTFYEGESVTTSFTCAEGTNGPGLTECSDGTTGSVSGPNGSGSDTLPTGTPGANVSYTVTVESSDGQSAFDTITYSVAAPPVAEISTVNGSFPVPDSTYYAGEVIPVSYGCNVGTFGTGLVSCNGIGSTGAILDDGTVGLGDGYLFTSGIGTFDKFVATATSSDGGVGVDVFFYTVAALPSVTSLDFNGSAASDGVTFYQGESVSTSFTCAEGTDGTGLASCNDASGDVGTITGSGAASTGSGGGTISTSTVGTDYSYTVNVASTDGGTASQTVTYNVAALPTATINSPGNNLKFNLGQDVPTGFSCTEGTDGPGLASCTDGVTGSVSGQSGSGAGTLPTGSVGSHTYTVTVTSDDGATSTAAINYIVVGPPTAKINFPATGLTFNQHQLVVTGFSCAEALNGPGIHSCVDSNGSPFGFGVLNTSTPGAHTYTVTATSKDGLTGTATITYTVVGPPTAAISLPLNNQKFNLHQVVSTTFACTEAANGPGIKSCTDLGGANSPHGTLNTSTPGVHTYTVIATSKDGQFGTATITYTVVGPPTATIFAPGNNGRYLQNQVVATTFGCADAPFGPGISSCTDSGGANAPHGRLNTSLLGVHSYTVTATSVDGQKSSATIVYTVIK